MDYEDFDGNTPAIEDEVDIVSIIEPKEDVDAKISGSPIATAGDDNLFATELTSPSPLPENEEKKENVEDKESIEPEKEEEMANRWVWFPDEKLVWNKGLVLTTTYVENPKGGDGWREYVISISENPPILKNIRADKVHRVDPTHLDDLDNLCLMNDMHEAPLLELLRRRFERKVIYTYTGDVLISVNPYEIIPGLYSDPLSLFNIQPSGSSEEMIRTGSDENQEKLSKPHVFQISNKALRSLVYGNIIDDKIVVSSNQSYFNQSIIISGESGAGKTENSKHVVNFLIEANNYLSHYQTSNTSTEERFAEYLKGILVESSVVLEAFGNAKTVRNDNSSRFGKYIKLLYTASEGEDDESNHTQIPKLTSAVIETFLLEKSRLAYVGQGERSYHIFYQLMIGLTEEKLRNELGLSNANDFRMLAQGSCGSTFEDRQEFLNTVNAFQILKCSPEEISEIWKLLATILHLNNLDYQKNETAGDAVQVVSALYPLAQIAENLGVGMEQMITSLTTQQLIVMKRSSIKVKILSAAEVANNVLALIKWLYSKLFDWIVSKINHCFNITSVPTTAMEEQMKRGFIGILDIFGFEILGVNSFEQLCINFTNERLQQQFNEYVFVTEQSMYRKEGLQWSNITFRDNQPVIDLIASSKKPLGLLLILEEQGMLNRKPDDLALLASFNAIHEVKDAKGRVVEGSIYSRSRFGKDSFTIKHFAGEVTYAVDGFLMKNNDSLQDDLISLLNTSSNLFLRNVMKFKDTTPGQLGYIPTNEIAVVEAAPSPTPLPTAPSGVPNSRATASGKKMASAVSVSLHFRQQLDALMTTLTSTTPNYIKCVKPNAVKKKEIFDPHLVIQQLRYSGVLEVVRIRREGFPVRISFHAFYRDFEILARGKPKDLFPGPDQCTFEQAKRCAEILATSSMPSDAFQIGTSVLFLRQNGLLLMQEAIRLFYANQVVKIQSKYRSLLHRRCFLQLKNHLVQVQRYWRGYAQRLSYRRIRHAAMTIKYFYISKRLRQQFILKYQEILSERRQQATVRIQSVCRGVIARREYKKMYKAYLKRRFHAAVTIQCAFRCRQAKKRFQYRLNEYSVTKIQSMVRMYFRRSEFLFYKAIAIALQSIIRGFLYHRRYLRLKRRLIRVQSLFRRYQQRKYYQQQCDQIILIQSLARRYLASSQVMIQRASILCLQTWIRGSLVRRQYLSYRKNVILLQKCLRGYVCRSFYQMLRQRIITIQKIIRGFLVWQHYQLQYSAAMCLQALGRMMIARKNYHRTLIAAITLQAKTRSFLQYHHYQRIRERVSKIAAGMRGFLQRRAYRQSQAAIVRLQSFGRMINARRAYTESSIHILIVQSTVRRYLARRSFLFYRNKMILLQKMLRGYLTRQQYHYQYQQVIRLQAFGRMINQRRIYDEIIVSTIILQTVLRGYLQRLSYLRHRRLIIRLQSWYRMKKVSADYQVVRKRIIRLQAQGRKYIAMMQFAVYLVSILGIQAIIRRGLKRLQYLRKKQRAIVMQSLIRRYLWRQNFLRTKAAATTISRYYRGYSAWAAYQLALYRIHRIQVAVKSFLRNLQLQRRLAGVHNLCMDLLQTITGSVLSSTTIANTTGGKSRRRSSAAAASAANHHHQQQHHNHHSPEAQTNKAALTTQVLHHLQTYPEDRSIRWKKQTMRTLLHSVLISSNEHLLQALDPSCAEIFEVDLRGKSAAHYLAMYPQSKTLQYLSERMNRFRIVSTVSALDVLDFDDDKDDEKEDGANGGGNQALSQMKEALHRSVGSSSLKAGWLKKKRGGMMWQKRWMVLTEDYIIYYKNPQSINNPKFAIPLEGCTVQRLPNSRDPIVELIAPNMGEKKTLFGSSTKKSMQFLAESEKELQEWLFPLKAVAGVGTIRSSPPIHYIQTDLRRLWCQVQDLENETPLHLMMKSISGLLQTAVYQYAYQDYPEKEVEVEEVIAVLCWMVEFGAPGMINAQNLRGETVLSLAVERQVDPKIVRAILVKGGDAKIANFYGLTPFESIQNHPEKKTLYYETLIAVMSHHQRHSKPSATMTITEQQQQRQQQQTVAERNNYLSVGKLKGYSYLSLYFGQQIFHRA